MEFIRNSTGEIVSVSLPDKWSKKVMPDLRNDPGYEYYTDGQMCAHSVRMLSDHSIEVTPEDCADTFVVPWEVLMSMYLDNGIYGVTPQEGQHLPEVLKERDDLRATVQNHERTHNELEKHAYKTHAVLYRSDKRRKKHFFELARLKQALVKCAWRLHNQRETNRKVRAAFKQWAGAPNSGDINMAFTAEMCQALKIKKSDIPINLDDAILNKPGDNLIDTVKSARSLLEPVSPEGWVGTNPQFNSKNGF